MRTLLLCLLFNAFAVLAFAQTEAPYGEATQENLPEWVQLLYADHPDVGAVLDAFYAYYDTHPFVKNGHTQYLKRMLRERETYAFQMNNPELTATERQALKTAEQRYLEQYQQQQAGRSGNWISIGPHDWDHDAGGRSYAPGAAHVYTIEQSASDADLMYAGTATAGLWKSTNRGSSWTNVTLDLVANEVYAVEIDPTDNERVYAGMMGSIYRTTDGGMTWTPTGDASFQAQDLFTKDIKIAPGSAALWAATNDGLYRSTDNGDNWTEMLFGDFQEIEFHPVNSEVMYVIRQTGSRTEFYRSIDGGLTFLLQSGGWPVPSGGAENKRAEIAVTPAAPNKVYALLTGQVNGGSGLYGVYVSEDLGSTWTFSCCGDQPGGPASLDNINMMAWADDGTDDGGQYYYDLALAVSPTDADQVFVAGVNLWVSNDGGNTFTCPAKWSHSYKPNYVHADIHDVNYYPNGDLWVANDGGIFYSTDGGENFDRSMLGIAGSDFWGFGLGFNNDELMIGGAYHNGTLVKNGNVYINDWACIDGGDGVGGAVNPIREDQVYSNYNIKQMPADRTVAPITRSYAMQPSWTYVTGRFSQIEFASDNYNVHYFGNGNGLYKTEDDNRSVSQLYDFGEEVGDVEVAWTDPQTMYVTTFPGYWDPKKIYRTTDGGLSWTNITPPATASSGVPYDVEVSYNDAQVIWAARIGRSTGDANKIMRSDDGGTTWYDISSATLAGEELTNVITQRGTDNQLYLGTTRSVYQSPTGNAGWELFADGLPASARSRQLAISYRNGTLFNATNRSVWKSDLAQPSAVTPQIAVDKYFSGCIRDTFRFADHSTAPMDATFVWEFPGASWVSSTNDRNPLVVYSAGGNYDVSLTVDGVTQTLEAFIEVGDDCSAQIEAGQSLVCAGENGHFISSNSLDVTTNTMTLMAWIYPEGVQDNYTGLIFNDATGAGMNLRADNELGYHWPGGSTHWAWSSGLRVPEDQWSFVVMVITPEQVTMYLNEEEVTRTFGTPVEAAFWGNFRIGTYQGWTSRNFRGQIDEAVIWNRALDRDEIRSWRHLTKQRQVDPEHELYDETLLAYYQFNEFSGPVYDRANDNHGILWGVAARTASTAPIGDGSSSKQMVAGAGSYAFVEEELRLDFPEEGIYPNEEVVVTRLNNQPTILPENALPTEQYWIVNNYGPHLFTALTRVQFDNVPEVDENTAVSPEQFIVYQRPANAGLDAWDDYADQADAADGNSGTLVFGPHDNNIMYLGQFALGGDESLIVVETEEAPLADAWARVFPNPIGANGQLRIESQLAGQSVFQLFNAEGRLLQTTRFERSVYLRLTSLPAGTYAYRIVNGEQVTSGQLVKG